MNKTIQSNIIFCVLFIVVGSFLSSCITTKKLTYFQDIPDSTKLNNLKLSNYIDPVIHSDDVLAVTILTTDPAATIGVNSSVTTLGSAAPSSSGPSEPVGYIVDNMGYVEIPVLGKIKVANLTLDAAKQLIAEQAKIYFVNPSVIIKNKSFKITVLGEVNRPGMVYVSSPKINIIDALGLFGDLTSYSKRDNILLLRKNDDNTLSTITLDLTKTDVIRSPYFYLKSNDVLIVKPNNSRAVSTDATFNRSLTLATTLVSIVSLIFIIVRR